MERWNRPSIPVLPGTAPQLSLYDTLSGEIRPYTKPDMRLWVCGITPYDATHLGHAFTYVSFDTLARVWSDSGRPFASASNVTDIDDPLFERAAATGVDWRELGTEQTQLFRDDMSALGVIPPDSWTSISEILGPLEELIRSMEANGQAYRVSATDGSQFVYANVGGDDKLASAAVFDGMDLVAVFDDNGGDSTQPGKRDPLDPQLWKGIRADNFQPEGLAPGAWRPGWHIECALIGLTNLGRIDVQAGGRDLVFPHHEMSEHHIRELSGEGVEFHSHAGLVAYEGHKMSKSRGNLVLVSHLRTTTDARIIRLSLLAHHYRSDWEFTNDDIVAATERLAAWTEAMARNVAAGAPRIGENVLADVRSYLASDLDMPAALHAVDSALESVEAWASEADRELVRNTIDALMGVKL